MSKKIKQKNNHSEKGFTLLFAVLISVLVLAVGASIINIALKQVVLSSIGRDSQYAFYAANTGIECALYWDFAGVGGQLVFATSSESISNITNNGSYCAGIDIAKNIDDKTENFVVKDSDLDTATTDFRLIFPGVEYCVDVSVIKKKVVEDGRTQIRTELLSRGYNTCDESNPRRIERGLELNY